MYRKAIKSFLNLGNPDKQKQDISALKRDTTNTLNKLGEIFDRNKIEERQELAAVFSELAMNRIHYMKNLTAGERALLHGAVGLVAAGLTNNDIGSTALAGGANAFIIHTVLNDENLKKYFNEHPDQLQWISGMIGAAVGNVTGGSSQTGASIAISGTKENLELDAHSMQVRKEQYLKIVDAVNKQYKKQLEVGKVCSDEEAYASLDKLEKIEKEAEYFGITPAASELLSLFLTQDFDKYGITSVETTKDGYKIAEFGRGSKVQEAYKNNYILNLELVKNAIAKRGKADAAMPTDVDVHSFYADGVDMALALGNATAFVTFQKNSTNTYATKITIFDNWDHSEVEANIGKGTFLEDAYKVQQSGIRKTFAYKTTYDLEFSLAELWPHIYGEDKR